MSLDVLIRSIEVADIDAVAALWEEAGMAASDLSREAVDDDPWDSATATVARCPFSAGRPHRRPGGFLWRSGVRTNSRTSELPLATREEFD